MNRNIRRFGSKRNEYDGRIRCHRIKYADVEEVMPAHRPKKDFKDNKHNRCCFTSLDQRSIGQLTEPDLDSDLFPNLLENVDIGPLSQEKLDKLQKLQKSVCESRNQLPIYLPNKVDVALQQSKPHTEVSTGRVWEQIDNAAEIDRIIAPSTDRETITKYHSLPKKVHISDVPRVKIIAAKYTKYRQENVEVRKLDEKVVCVEYDVYDKWEDGAGTPVQAMRAFFSIRPIGNKTDDVLTELPSTIKNKFNISSKDFQKLNKREIEIIDGKIQENQPYLKQLRKLLQRKQTNEHTHSLNLQTLYEMANREYLNINTDNTNFLTKDELNDIQKLILGHSKSSAHGISRLAVKEIDKKNVKNISVISQTILNELLREE